MDSQPIVFIVDDDEGIREGLSLLLETVGLLSESYASANEFMDAYDPTKRGCLVLDIRMPGMTGLDLQMNMIDRGATLPIIFITGHGDIPMAVEAMRRGALDFIRKPFREQDLLDRINEALALDAHNRIHQRDREALIDKITSLTGREHEVYELVAEGKMNKIIASDLGISERTVEVHRAQVMKKLDARTLAQLVRIKIATEPNK